MRTMPANAVPIPTSAYAPGFAGQIGQEDVRDATDGTADHGADKKAGAENAARVSGRIADRRRDDLHHGEESHDFPREVASEYVIYVVVSHPQDFGHEQAEQSDQQTASDRLKPDGRSRKASEPDTQLQQKLDKAD